MAAPDEVERAARRVWMSTGFNNVLGELFLTNIAFLTTTRGKTEGENSKQPGRRRRRLRLRRRRLFKPLLKGETLGGSRDRPESKGTLSVFSPPTYTYTYLIITAAFFLQYTTSHAFPQCFQTRFFFEKKKEKYPPMQAFAVLTAPGLV